MTARYMEGLDRHYHQYGSKSDRLGHNAFEVSLSGSFQHQRQFVNITDIKVKMSKLLIKERKSLLAGIKNTYLTRWLQRCQ